MITTCSTIDYFWFYTVTSSISATTTNCVEEMYTMRLRHIRVAPMKRIHKREKTLSIMVKELTEVSCLQFPISLQFTSWNSIELQLFCYFYFSDCLIALILLISCTPTSLISHIMFIENPPSICTSIAASWSLFIQLAQTCVPTSFFFALRKYLSLTLHDDGIFRYVPLFTWSVLNN